MVDLEGIKERLSQRILRESDVGALVIEVERLREVLEVAEEIAFNSPELNPSNYDHDEVCELNAIMVELYISLKTAREALKEG